MTDRERLSYLRVREHLNLNDDEGRAEIKELEARIAARRSRSISGTIENAR